MQGLVNFTNECALILAVLLPTACYIAAIASFLFGAWALWQQAHPHNPFRGRPWVPLVCILLSGVFSAFDRILTKFNNSAGTGVTVDANGSVTSYTNAPVANSILGNTPGDALENIFALFGTFFQVFGAWCAFAAVLAWQATIKGHTNRGRLGCLVQFAFGMVLINSQVFVAWIVNVFNLQA